jgi:hypothetical protein
MSDLTLAGIELPDDLNWSDEFTAWKVGQAVKLTLTGAQIIQESAQQAGRPITLESQQEGGNWVAVVSLSTLRFLQALEEVPGAAPMTLVMPAHNTGTRTFSVVWRRTSGAAIEAKPLKFISPAADGDFFAVTLRLMTV